VNDLVSLQHPSDVARDQLVVVRPDFLVSPPIGILKVPELVLKVLEQLGDASIFVGQSCVLLLGSAVEVTVAFLEGGEGVPLALPATLLGVTRAGVFGAAFDEDLVVVLEFVLVELEGGCLGRSGRMRQMVRSVWMGWMVRMGWMGWTDSLTDQPRRAHSPWPACASPSATRPGSAEPSSR